LLEFFIINDLSVVSHRGHLDVVKELKRAGTIIVGPFRLDNIFSTKSIIVSE